MNYRFGDIVVIGLGGSIVYPDDIDVRYLKEFKSFLEKELRSNRKKKFVIVMGGGHLARIFQDAVQNICAVIDEDKDWIGIHATRLNAQLIRNIFVKTANPVIFDERGKMKKLQYPVTVASGWRPGWSTDFVAAAIAKDLNAKEFIIAGKPDFVYDRDPKVDKNAKPFAAMTWKKYRRLVPAKWVPGSHSPIDTVAAKLSASSGIASIVIDGRDLKNFKNLLAGEEFRGTVIR